MVKKLFKYESKYYLRLFMPFALIVLASALFMRIIFAFKMDNVVFDVIYGSAKLLFGVAISVCFGSVTVLSVMRFFKNLYGPEGYLSFTLPVTATEHIFAKLLASYVFYLLAAAISVFGFIIATAGEVFEEFMKAASYLLKLTIRENGWDMVLLLFEILIMVLVLLVFDILLFYTCISLGQTAKKARVFMSFVYYFIYYAITQAIGTIFVIVISVISIDPEQLSAITTYIKDNIDWLMHVVPWVITITLAGLSAAFFAINRSIMIKKLNLE